MAVPAKKIEHCSSFCNPVRENDEEHPNGLFQFISAPPPPVEEPENSMGGGHFFPNGKIPWREAFLDWKFQGGG